MSDGVVVVGDEVGVVRAQVRALRLGGFSLVRACLDVEHIERQLDERVGVVLLQVELGARRDVRVLEMLRARHPSVSVIVVTGSRDVDTAVACMRAGAVDCLAEPVDESVLVERVWQAMAMPNEAALHRPWAPRRTEGDAFAAILTRDPGMRRIFAFSSRISVSNEPVLITGETGTGKELLAKALHDASGRRGPFVAVNVAGLDGTVFSDTLLGHVSGAYTGAAGGRRGLIGQAAGGTLFLDEVGDLSVEAQVKLLRLLQQREYRPLGSDRVLRVECRILAAMHAPLSALRPDLYFRLRGYQVHVPPLRERSGDIPLLFRHFVTEAAADLQCGTPDVPEDVLDLLGRHAFPGNVRELRSIAYHAVASADDAMTPSDVLPLLDGTWDPVHTGVADSIMTEEQVRALEVDNMRRALEWCGGRVSGPKGAAALLGLRPSTLTSRLRKAGLA